MNLRHTRERVERMQLLRCRWDESANAASGMRVAMHDPDCSECAERNAALAELALAEAVIEAARHAVSHYDATDTVPWIEDLIDAVTALDASPKEAA